MIPRAVALAAALAVLACGGAVLERSAPARPAWMRTTPAARDSLYFVGICSERVSYEEGLRCARAEALTDVAAWVGARFEASVYSVQSEAVRAGGSTAYLDAEMFLAGVRRDATYHEVRREEWGRSYLVSVLVAYPRAEAEAERGRIEEATRRGDRLVAEASQRVRALAAEGRWGAAMDDLVRTTAQVVVPRNLSRELHANRLRDVARDLVTPLALSAQIGRVDPDSAVRGAGLGPHSGLRVVAEARYAGHAAQGVPLQCVARAQETRVETDADGRAACDFAVPPAGETVEALVRPEVRGYVAALPAEAGGLAAELSALLDKSVRLDVSAPLDVEVVLEADKGCGPALAALRARLERAGVRLSSAGSGAPVLTVTCRVEDVAGAGALVAAEARARMEARGAAGTVARVTELEPVRGLGTTAAAARAEALARLGAALGDAALQLLRELNDDD